MGKKETRKNENERKKKKRNEKKDEKKSFSLIICMINLHNYCMSDRIDIFSSLTVKLPKES